MFIQLNGISTSHIHRGKQNSTPETPRRSFDRQLISMKYLMTDQYEKDIEQIYKFLRFSTQII